MRGRTLNRSRERVNMQKRGIETGPPLGTASKRSAAKPTGQLPTTPLRDRGSPPSRGLPSSYTPRGNRWPPTASRPSAETAFGSVEVRTG